MSIVDVSTELVGEGVVGALVDMDLVGNFELGSQALVDLSGSAPVVVLGKVALNRASNLRDVHGRVRQAVEGCNGGNVGELYGGCKRESTSHTVSSDCESEEEDTLEAYGGVIRAVGK